MATNFSNLNSIAVSGNLSNQTTPAPAATIRLYLIIMTSIGVAIFIINTIFLLIILFYRRLRTIPNVMMCSMSISGILFAVIYIIPRYVPISSEEFCKMLPFIGVSLALIINLHQCVIGYHRYMAVANPVTHRRQMTKAHVAIILVLIWLLPFLASISPYVFYRPIKPGYCRTFGFDTLPTVIFYGTIYSLFFYLPLIIVVFGYIYIHILAITMPKDKKLIKRGTWKSRIHRHRHVLVHTAIIIELHTLCWTPFITVSLAWYAGFKPVYFATMVEVLLNIAFSYPAINPIVYAYFTVGIRRRILALVGYKKNKRSSTSRSNQYGVESSAVSM